MQVRTKYLLGLVLGTLAGATACAVPQDAPPDLKLSSDPATARNGATDHHAPTNPTLTKTDGAALPASPAPAADGGGGDVGDGGHAGPGSSGAADAGGAYGARCSNFPAGDREHESNDTLATANALVAIACAGIDSANDVDWFAVATQSGLFFTFQPDDDAVVTVTSPSGKTDSSGGPAVYSSGESGTYSVQVRSPGHRTQTYLLVRN